MTVLLCIAFFILGIVFEYICIDRYIIEDKFKKNVSHESEEDLEFQANKLLWKMLGIGPDNLSDELKEEIASRESRKA